MKDFNSETLSKDNPLNADRNVCKYLWEIKNLKGSQSSSNIIKALRTILEYATKHMDKFLSIGLSRSLHILASIKTKCTSGLNHVGSDVLDKFYKTWFEKANKVLQEFNAQGLSNSIWALAKLNLNDCAYQQFITNWIGIASKIINKFNAQELSNSICALAKLNDNDQLKVDDTSIKAFVNIWILAANKEIGKQKKFNAQGLSNSIWALDKLNLIDKSDCDHQQFIAKWIQLASDRINQFNAQDLSSSICALNNLRNNNQLNGENQALMKGFVCEWITQANSELKNFNRLECEQSIGALRSISRDSGYKIHCSSIKDWISSAEKRLEEILSTSEDVANSHGMAETEYISDNSICDQLVNTELSSTKLESSKAFFSRRK